MKPYNFETKESLIEFKIEEPISRKSKISSQTLACEKINEDFFIHCSGQWSEQKTNPLEDILTMKYIIRDGVDAEEGRRLARWELKVHFKELEIKENEIRRFLKRTIIGRIKKAFGG